MAFSLGAWVLTPRRAALRGAARCQVFAIFATAPVVEADELAGAAGLGPRARVVVAATLESMPPLNGLRADFRTAMQADIDVSFGVRMRRRYLRFVTPAPQGGSGATETRQPPLKSAAAYRRLP